MRLTASIPLPGPLRLSGGVSLSGIFIGFIAIIWCMAVVSVRLSYASLIGSIWLGRWIFIGSIWLYRWMFLGFGYLGLRIFFGARWSWRRYEAWKLTR